MHTAASHDDARAPVRTGHLGLILWKFPDGHPSEDVDAQHSADGPGTRPVRCRGRRPIIDVSATRGRLSAGVDRAAVGARLASKSHHYCRTGPKGWDAAPLPGRRDTTHERSHRALYTPSGSAWSVVTWAPATAGPTGAQPPISGRAAIPSSSRSSRVRTGGGASWTRRPSSSTELRPSRTRR
jgi:hypothetical protein